MAFCMTIALLALSAEEFEGFYFWKNGIYVRYDIREMLLENNKITIGDTIIDVNEVDSITFEKPDETVQNITDTLYITYNGSAATVTPQNVEGITTQTDGAAVTITNTNTDREMCFVLSGESTTGSFTYNGDYKACIRLAGVSLKSTNGAALDIKCGKRIALELLEGTNNYLEDTPDSLGQKAALYCKGHLEVSKGGTLNVKGNNTHAIKTKEYMLVKSSTGSITVSGAEKDGIHAGQYFKMNGSTVNISGVKGDGIQVEATGEGDDYDGQIMLRDGTLDISVTERGVDGIKSDSLLTITGGTININTTGDGSKAIKSKDNLTISGGNITINQSGQYIVENNDPGYVVAIKAAGNIDITGSTIVVNNTAEAGKGISADGNLNISEGDTKPVINIQAHGSGAALDLSRNVEVSGSESGDGSGGEEGDQETVYRICVALSSSNSTHWKQVVYLYTSSGTKIDQLTNTITVSASGQTTQTFYYYDFDEVPDGTFYFASDDYTRSGGGKGGSGKTYAILTSAVNGPTETKPTVYYYINTASYTRGTTAYTFTVSDYTSRYKDGTITGNGSVAASGSKFATATGIKGDADITIAGGDITIDCTGAAAKAISCNSVLQTLGGTINITNSGAGTGTTSNYSTAKGLTCDGSIDLQGADITITMSGAGGKGIKSDGTLVIGKSDTEGPNLTVKTSGAKYLSTSSAKAIKAQGAITVNGGECVVNTTQNGAEGMESKLKSTSSVAINGGRLYFKCYDDCINTAGCIRFDGGITVCYSNGNDAIDSNYGSSGAIQIGDGTVLTYTSAGGPEEGFDCDNNSYIQITGNGIGISAGGSQGGGGGGGWNPGGTSSSGGIGSAVQGYYLSTSSISYSTGRYYTLADANGKNLVTYSFEANVSSSLSLFTATGMTKGSSYTVKYSSTKPTDATTEWHGLYLGSNVQGTTSTTSFTAQ